MKLLLHTDIPKLGYFGDVVEVAEGYGRNYLVPQGLAVRPTNANIKAIEEERAAQVEKRRLVRAALEKVAKKVNGVEITIQTNANEQGNLYGSVTETEIAKVLQEKGHAIKATQVVLAEHLRMLGSYNISLRFADDLKSEIKVLITGTGSEDQDGNSESESEQSPESAE